MSEEKYCVRFGKNQTNKDEKNTMSRIGRTPVTIPNGVTVAVENGNIVVKGPKGMLTTVAFPGIAMAVADGKATFARQSDEPNMRAAHGLMRSLVANMITGVTDGFEKKLEMVGTGYRVAVKGKGITLSVGYSHPVEIIPPEGITFAIEGNNKISVKGIDKGLVGQIAANIRDVRPPEPYKGKGIRYEGEEVRRKVGKAATKAAGAK